MASEQRPQNHWIKCLTTQGNIRGIAMDASELVAGMAKIHQLTGPAAQGFGEAILGALLLGSCCKPGERVNLNIQGSGDFAQALVDAYPNGVVRGYVIPRTVGSQAGEKGKDGHDLGPWGDGLLSVLRTKDQAGEQPYIGTVPLVTGHLAKDLSFYWVQSEQIPSAVGIVVRLKNNEIHQAGAFLVQALPGASDAEVKMIEQHVQEIESYGMLPSAAGVDPMKVLSQIFQNTAFMVLEERELKFECNCSWERVNRALSLIGTKELQAMLKEDQSATVHCDFCTKEYKVDAEGLQSLIDRSKGK